MSNPRTVYWLLLASMTFAALATAVGLGSQTGGRLLFAVTLLVAQFALAGFAATRLSAGRAARRQ